jgi:hypothetical protein
VLFAASVTRTATRAARSGVDVATADVLAAAVLTERVVWLASLTRPVTAVGRRIGMSALRGYLAAMVLVIVKIIEAALGH